MAEQSPEQRVVELEKKAKAAVERNELNNWADSSKESSDLCKAHGPRWARERLAIAGLCVNHANANTSRELAAVRRILDGADG